MTDTERFSLLYSLMPTKFGTTTPEPRVPADIPNIAGYVQGVLRLGIPPLTEIDASLGVHWVGGTDSSRQLFLPALLWEPLLIRRLPMRWAR